MLPRLAVVHVPGGSPVVGGAAAVFLPYAVRVFLVRLRALLALTIEFLLRLLVDLPLLVGLPLHSRVGPPLLVGQPLACGSVVAC